MEKSSPKHRDLRLGKSSYVSLAKKTPASKDKDVEQRITSVEKKGAKLSFYKIPTGQFPTSSTRSLAGELWLQAGTFQETDVKGHHHCFQFMDMKNIKHVVACDTAMQREQWLKTLVALSADEPTGVSGLPARSKFEAGAGVMSSNPAYE